jgi:tetratricopeptide (TPR) repeat protein
MLPATGDKMGKKKKSRKARKQANRNLQNLPLRQLIQKGDACFTAGSYREAIKILKIANGKDPADEKTKRLLGRAYTLRESQLRQKGMHKEADALHHQVRQYRPDADRMDAEELLFYLEATTPEDAVSLYGRFLQHSPPLHEAEIELSGAALIAMDGPVLSQLPDTALMKPDLPILMPAVDLMHDGDWEAALDHLKPLARRSPLAPVKLFCRAMACFYRKDDAGMKRALAMIPQSSPLAPLAKHLAERSSDIPDLWEGHFIAPNESQSLLRAAESDYLAGTARQLKRIALRIRPHDPKPAIEQLLTMLLPLARGRELDMSDLCDLAEKVLPGSLGETIAARFYFLEFFEGLNDAVDYLNILENEFPDAADHDLAASMIMSASVKWLVEKGRQFEAAELRNPLAKSRLGITATDTDCILLEILIKALELDPHNDQAIHLLMERPRPSRQATRLKEAGLTLLMDKLPAEPAPCLHLARLYLNKNAVRKAEKCIREAGRRAPYDEQVTDLHVLTLIKSIDNNFNRSKHHLVKADLKKAESLSSTKLAAFIAARRILFETEQSGQLSLFGEHLKPPAKGQLRTVIEQHIADLPAIDQFRALGILAHDCRQRPTDWSKLKRNCLAFCFKKRTALVETLTSRTVRDMLLPAAGDVPAVAQRPDWLDLFLKRYKRILNRLNDEDILPLLEVLVEAGRFDESLREIRRRRKTASEPFDIFLTFYQMVIQSIDGKKSADAETFEAFVAGVPRQHREMLRAAAKRLYPFARGPLRAALEHFDFKLLNGGCNCPICSGRMDMDEDEGDWPEDDFFDPLDAGPAGSIIGLMEMFIETNQLRGASPKILKSKRNSMMNSYTDRIMLEEIADMLPPGSVEFLSAEARYLFFGQED